MTINDAWLPRRQSSLRNGGMTRRLPIVLSIALSAACNPFEKSDYSNCVVAKAEANYIGENLKHTSDARRSTMLTEECVAADQRIDLGDGSKAGKVRWVVCYVGPDCDEAGMF